MAFVVQAPCIGCKYGDCVEVCPVTCFYEGPDQVYINPEECIDCNACVPACPVEAIVSQEEADAVSVKKNADFAFSEDKRRTSKSDVTHGPNWDAEKA